MVATEAKQPKRDRARLDNLRLMMSLAQDFVLAFLMYLWAFKSHLFVDAVVTRLPQLEACTYVAVAFVPQALILLMRSRRRGTLKCIADRSRSATLRHLLYAARWPLARGIEAVLYFLSVNFLVLALPVTFQIEAPHHLRFLDPDGDGVFTADEIEELIGKVSIRLLLTFFANLLGVFLLQARAPPQDLTTECNGLERYWMQVKRRHGWFVIADIFLTAAIASFIVLKWLMLLGFTPNTILTFGSVGGLAFGLAAQSLVGNFMSGLLILITQPFIVGDWIETDSAKGYVRMIRWNQTEIETLDGPVVVIPNNSLVGMQTLNRTKGTSRSMEFEFPVLFPQGGFDDVANLLEGLEGEVAELDLCSEGQGLEGQGLSEHPCAYFLGVDASGDEPVSKVKLEVMLDNAGLGEVDDLRSLVNITAVRYFQVRGCTVPGLEVDDE